MAVTPGRTGSTSIAGGSQGVDACPKRAVPPGPLPDDTHAVARAAASALGWNGEVLTEARVLGRKIHMVARLRPEAHAERIANDYGPVIDRTEVATWTWPELADVAPSPAVDITGVVVVTRHWRTALASVVPFARYFDAAIVLPAEAAVTHDYVDNCLPRARAYGVSLLTVDGDEHVHRDLSGSTERIMLGTDPISRWCQELAYEQILDATDLEASAP
ncbi:hypothetical protein [Haloechinothrix sp. LS1_15]|uniref:hypothetical protein n=1 Tax=Haloechinothrix sp. LS1_15 TaxID=2652248 RepID=UPI002947149F|nr:hypothetical protein [Haloechinothrix sp. LS1_15]MDV6010898.1 hypothetical protein [Haloechinothrix sp. LS1_15]